MFRKLFRSGASPLARPLATLLALVAVACAPTAQNATVPEVPSVLSGASEAGNSSTAREADTMKLLSSKNDTTVHELENGLRVVVREDHFAPVAAVQIWVGAGGADEFNAEAGVAHVHEHMLFKGTKTRGVGEIASQVESAGGQINAWTSWDHTVYHVVMASRYADEALEILADAVRHSTFDEAELAKELGVVMEEYKRSKDSPTSRLFHRLLETAFDEHPYKRPVIGTKESIEGLNREKILSFYHRFYAPNNMTVVVVGDVEAGEVIEKVKELFADVSERGIPRPIRKPEPPQHGTRFAHEQMEIQEAHMALGFHIPSAKDADAIPLDVLAHILGGGESARLYRRLVADEQIASGTSAFAYTPPDPGIFLISASFEPKDERAVFAALLDEVRKLMEDDALEVEIARAKANLESDFIYKRQTVQGQARELGYFATVHNDLNYDRKYIEALRGVTAEDIQRVVWDYLHADNLTVVSLTPNNTTAQLSHRGVVDMTSAISRVDRTGQAAIASAVDAPKTVDSLDGTGPYLVMLDNGVRIIVQEHPGVPTFAVRAATLAGLLAETRENNGISNFTAAMLTRGTKKRSREELAGAVESLAGDIQGFSGRNSLGVSGTFLARHFDQGMDLFLETLLEPAFDPDEVEKTRRELLLGIKNREDNASGRSFDLVYNTLYRDHPYGMTTIGEESSILSLDAEQLATFYQDVIDPSSLVISVVGDIDARATVEKLRTALSGLENDDTPFEMPPAVPSPDKVQTARKSTDRQQTHIVIGYPGVHIRHPDRHALSVLETILARQGGRLFYELRDQQALAYSVTAFSSEGLAPGIFGAYIATDPTNETKAIDGLLEEMAKVRSEEVEDDELSRARRYLIGAHEIAQQTNGSIAESMLFNELYGLGFKEGQRYAEDIRAVGKADVLRVASTYLDPAIHAVAIVGPKKKR